MSFLVIQPEQREIMSAVPFEVIADFRKSAKRQFQELNPEFHPYRFKIKRDYPIRLNGELVYYAHSMHFDLMLAESWREALNNNFQDLSFEDLLHKVWDSSTLKEEGVSFRHDLNLSFEEFNDLVKRQFLFVSHEEESYLFSLYSILEDNGLPTGGFFHFLVGHFEEYSTIHPQRNDETEYWPNDLLRVMTLVALDPDEEKIDREKENGDYVYNRKRVCKYYSRLDEKERSTRFSGAFYYDSRSNLAFINTFHRC